MSKEENRDNTVVEKPIKTYEEMFDEAYDMGVEACIQMTKQSYNILKTAIGEEEIERFYPTYNTLATHFQKLKKKP